MTSIQVGSSNPAAASGGPGGTSSPGSSPHRPSSRRGPGGGWASRPPPRRAGPCRRGGVLVVGGVEGHPGRHHAGGPRVVAVELRLLGRRQDGPAVAQRGEHRSLGGDGRGGSGRSAPATRSLLRAARTWAAARAAARPPAAFLGLALLLRPAGLTLFVGRASGAAARGRSRPGVRSNRRQSVRPNRSSVSSSSKHRSEAGMSPSATEASMTATVTSSNRRPRSRRPRGAVAGRVVGVVAECLDDRGQAGLGTGGGVGHGHPVLGPVEHAAGVRCLRRAARALATGLVIGIRGSVAAWRDSLSDRASIRAKRPGASPLVRCR